MATIAAQAELFVSVQDGKQMLVEGKSRVVEGVDTLSMLESKNGRLRIVAEIPLPASVIAPPTSLAIMPGGASALVAVGFKRDPADAGKGVTDDTLSVVDLKSMPPRVSDTLHMGKGAAGVAVNAAGTLALVANHAEGTVSVLSVNGAKVAVVGQPGRAVAGAAPDGYTLLLTGPANAINASLFRGPAVRLSA